MDAAEKPLTTAERLALAERDPRGRFVKGHKPSGGRPKGALGVITRSLREQVLEGLGDIPKFVTDLAAEYPPAAAGLLAKLMPAVETADNVGGGTVTVNILPVRSGTYIEVFDPHRPREPGRRPPELHLVVNNRGMQETIELVDDTLIVDPPNVDEEPDPAA
jgi:hypothetical protein